MGSGYLYRVWPSLGPPDHVNRTLWIDRCDLLDVGAWRFGGDAENVAARQKFWVGLNEGGGNYERTRGGSRNFDFDGENL